MSRRRAALVAVPGLSYVAVTVALVLLGRSFASAALLALIPAGCYAVGTVAADRTVRTRDVPGRPIVALQTSAWAGWFASSAAVALATLHVRHGVALGALTAVPAWFWFSRTTATSVAIGTQAPQLPAGLDDARRQIAACRRRLRAGRMSPERRAWVKFNLVGALTYAGGMTGDAQQLLEGVRLLEELLAEPALSGAQKSLIANEYSDTMSMLASLGGDEQGWPGALEQQMRIATALPAGFDRQVALMRAHGARAQWHQFHLSRLERDADGTPAPEFEPELDATIRCLAAALEAAPPGIGLIAHYRMEWATYLMYRDPEAGIAGLRQAYEESRDRPLSDRENIQLSFGMNLAMHAELLAGAGGDPAAVRAEMDQAERLLQEVADDGKLLGGHAAGQLAALRARRVELGKHRPDVGALLRLAYQRLSGTLVNDASGAAQAWADWAADECDAADETTDAADALVAEAADAHAAVAREFALEVARRTDPAEIRRHSASMQGVAAEAGYWLARAGRPEEAVAAVESARALLLTSRVQRLPADVGARLRIAGHEALRRRFVAAEEALDQAERVRYEEIPGRAVAPGTVSTPDRTAWLTFQAVRQEVDAALRRNRPATETPVWDARLGRLVYLAAARRGGYALVVDGAGARAVPLPELTAADLAAEVARFGALVAAETPDAAAWQRLLVRLGRVMAPVTGDLRPGADVVVVPLGGLGLLPLHAARTPRGHLDERVTVRYAPNARLFLEAARAASAGTPTSALVADAHLPAARTAAPMPELRFAAEEARWVAGRLPGAALLPDARLARVLAGLDDADVWHFACHGVADPAEPLDSAVLLADAPLRLRHLLGRRAGRHRLAVLSACQTSVPDPGRLDEVVGFPGALLRTGVAGVIATQWRVDDAAAALVVRRFYEVWLGGAPPHVALAAAQRWLRQATQAEVTRALGTSALVPPEHPTGRWARRPYADRPWTWAAFTYTGS